MAQSTHTIYVYAQNKVDTVQYVDSIKFNPKPDPKWEYVDLGLSVKWATFNLGASTPEDYGEYYAWGETQTKSTFTSSNYYFGIGENASKYNNRDKIQTLTGDNDAATIQLGGNWRIPTAKEFEELRRNCSWEQATVNGVNGYKITAKNGNSIFLPFSGTNIDALGTPRLTGLGTNGYYWTSDIAINKDSTFNSSSAQAMIIPNITYRTTTSSRFNGLTIRPVWGDKPNIPEKPAEPDPVSTDPYVDLGLPSGLKWASANLGGKAPEDLGDYYAWGEDSTKTKFGNATYKYYDTATRTYTKYNESDSLTVLESKDDAAKAILGGKYRIPTVEDMQELHDNCTWTWTTRNGVKGYKITGKNGKAIFLPAAGSCLGSAFFTDPYQVNMTGHYWTNSLFRNSSTGKLVYASAVNTKIDSTSFVVNYAGGRSSGFSIRPVYDENAKDEPTTPTTPTTQEDTTMVDLGLPSGTKWRKYNLGATKAEEIGGYYSWGETTTKAKYGWNYYKYGTSTSNLTKYNTTDSIITLNDSDDAAAVILGNGWSMPTKAQAQELISNCTWTWTTLNGVNGYEVKSKKNDNSIFLPASGYCWGLGMVRDPYQVGTNGRYWTKDISTGIFGGGYDFGNGNAMFISSDSRTGSYGTNRNCGLTIRPVHK